MKKSVFILAMTLFMAVGFTACGSSDQKIQKEVTTLLAPYADAKAEVKDGVLTLTGDVESDEAKTSVEGLLTAVKGVKSVVNNLTVKPKIVINPDDTISTAVGAALTAAGYKGVNVQVKDGEVTLTGELKRTDLMKVMQIVSESNPKKVINQLSLK